MQTTPPPTLTPSGLHTLQTILSRLVSEFDGWCTAHILYHTVKQATLTIVPVNAPTRPPDPYTAIHCHVNIESLNAWQGTRDEAYEAFCDRVGSELQQTFRDGREHKRRKPNVTMVIVRL